MRCTFKTVFYVNGSKDRNGIVPIMGRVTINGTIAQFSCKQSVTKAICDILAVFLQSKSIKLVVMTLKELLDSLSFDEIAPNAFIGGNRKRVRDAAFFLIIMLVTFAATLLKPQKYVSSRTIQKCVEHVSTST